MKKVYNTLFSIQPRDKRDSLEKIIETAKDWIAPGLRGKALKEFMEGVDIDIRGIQIKTILAEADGNRHFAMMHEMPDQHNRGFRKNTTFCVSEQKDEGFLLSITLSQVRHDDAIRPSKYRVIRPRLVNMLIDRFEAYGKYPLSTRPSIVKTGSAQCFVDKVKDRQRKIPIIYISCSNALLKPIVDTAMIANQLAGLAHTYVAESMQVSFEVGNIIGKDMNCYNGAVRIYWPMTRDSYDIIHEIWTPERISEKKHFHRHLLKLISRFSIGRTPPITYDRICSMKLARNIRELREKYAEVLSGNKEFEEVVNLYEQELEIAKHERNQAMRTIDELEQANRSLTARIQTLKNALNTKKGNTGDADAEGTVKPQSIDSMGDVLKNIDEQYDDVLIILKKARKSCKKSLFNNPKQVYDAIKWLATTYRSTRRGETRQDLKKSCIEQTGMQYKPGQSEVTMGENPQDYFVKWNNKNTPLTEHLVQGSSGKEQDMIRIAFFYDKKTSKVIIGYIGKHQKNRF